MKEIDDLQLAFRVARDNDSLTHILEFKKQLMASSNMDILEFHYELMADHINTRLYQIVRAAFLERGEVAMNFLSEKLNHEQRPEMRRDIVQPPHCIRCGYASPI